MTRVNTIKHSARALGACELIDSITSISDAIELLLSPRGREFALKTGFPTLDVWRKNHIEAEVTAGVFIDTKNIIISNNDIIVVGDSDATVSLCGTDKLYHIIAMHGAKIKVDIKNYAVATITAINATIEVFKDDSAVVDIENAGTIQVH